MSGPAPRDREVEALRTLVHLHHPDHAPAEWGPDHYDSAEAAAVLAGEWFRRRSRAARSREERRERQRQATYHWFTQSQGYAAVDRRSGGRCEAGVFAGDDVRCAKRATEHHHIRGRRVDDPHHPDNLWHLCGGPGSCHEWATLNPLAAKKCGLSADRLGPVR